MSMQQRYYLRENVYFEPLVLKWYAWPYLLPPVSAAMNITGRSLRLMKSFVANHQLHLAASKNPELSGGDFVNCSEDQLDNVRGLIHDIEHTHQDYLDLRKAVAKLNEMLEQAKGLSLEPLYAQVPEALRGYVELIYDMNHNASFRLIEGLIYESPLYKPLAQSVSLGLLGKVKERPFVLSSPRLPDENHLHVEVPFAHDFIDTLFAARGTPIEREQIDRLFDGVGLQGGLTVDELFTTEPPRVTRAALEGRLRVSYLGHAGLLLETERTSILVDPIIAVRDQANGDRVLSFSELPETIDYVCLTHTHMDHVCVETLLQLRHKIGEVLVPKNGGGSIVDPSIKLMLQTIGFKVREFEDMEILDCVDGRIRAIPFLGEHADLHIRSKTAWYFEFAGQKIFSGADSSSLDERMYERIQKVIGHIDLLFIGMECVGAPMSWLYGSLFTKPIPREINESRRFNGSDCASAQKMIEIFKPSQVYVYALGMEPWFKYFMGMDYTEDARQIQESSQLLEFCAGRQVQSERLFAKHVWNFS
ncbi:2-dehydro-3-deoxyphosphooctonate aldolase [Lysobacter antibioticus]|uniref:Metallo-beta-lactamase superfamily protein n=1 Tax=Lysobacter antibioticus TaxID=84531 RepID=A0A0S2DVP5_LYSAN|nr:MBL fold metallo-hydrolase [Lysobacter antibioticus]ALN62585.1 2-dehydro-3-deoxyphosphooctonate aldolase [Lysobacter antibioticus]ALN80260.1 metallo-beta-lactamase superfamily protein [Lysobacter antibioticus]